MKNIKLFTQSLALAPLLTLCSCSSVALRSDYDNYSQTYGDSINQQLLLNIVRESRQQPAYFLQLATIGSQYQYTTGASSGTPTTGWAVRHAIFPFFGQVQLTRVATPNFQFLPLTGSNFVQAVLTPMSDKVFWTFYESGWPADLMTRTTVGSIDQIVGTNITSKPIIMCINNISYTNLCWSTNAVWNVYLNDPTDPTYPKFLQCCYELDNAQTFHILTVDKSGKTLDDPPLIYSNRFASLKDLVAASSAGLTVKIGTNSIYVITKPGSTPDTIVYTNQWQLMENFFFTNPAVAYTTYSNAWKFADDYNNRKIKFITRTFEEALNAVANEQNSFQDYTDLTQWTNVPPDNAKITQYVDDCYGSFIIVHPDDGGADFPVRPILMTRYNLAARKYLAKTIELEYQSATYTIGDLENPDADTTLSTNNFVPIGWESEFQTQNSLVFTLISYLFSQTAVNTDNLPIQQLIQVQ